jgi:predicted metal-dependent hydrolase
MNALLRPTLEVRNLKFSLEGEVPRHWHGGRKGVTSFFDNLSVFFPAGERFFIQAVKKHKHLVTDEKLLKDIAMFCAQEGIHAREHDRYNEMLREQGYPVAELEAKIQALLDWIEANAPPRAQLSATCALEHFTALMGKVVLEDPRLLEGAHPVMRSLWRWHAAEENEHKSVAFDVHLATGSSHRERVIVMIAASLLFWALVLKHQARFMKVDGVSRSPKEWWRLFSWLFVEPGGLLVMWRGWFDYFRRDFHPNDAGTEGALEGWKKEYAASRPTAPGAAPATY